MAYAVVQRTREICIRCVILALLLMAVEVVACLVPERRATKVDPMVALRAE